ncbi:periplasmic sensor signal transduction histidine kinase [Caballeronia catudaia]|uniref:histidine kinase n=1 Tax=Caballeronia catudaia TaxID=1777136 RepID=A0A158CW88_9BURK|nr:sensor histidine kinase [Caballeronia catudaia]SAK86186.1 periplasmic sensor signal transduction histidine kinase [Caballeronia catudaia]
MPGLKLKTPYDRLDVSGHALPHGARSRRPITSARTRDAGVQPGLRARLLLWLLVPLALFVSMAAITGYDNARRTADRLQDRMLLASARIIAEDVHWNDGGPVADIPPAAFELFESPYRDQVFYKLETGSGQLLGGRPDLAAPDTRAVGPVFYHVRLAGMPVRAVAYRRELYDAGKVVPVTVIVAKTEGSRCAMLDELWRPQLVVGSLMLLLVAVLVPLGLKFELDPLMKLKDEVAGREPLQLEPMCAQGLPRELQPIVDAINQCIAQLKLHSEAQRQFVADAAHQLRTPLALLDAQLQYARRLDENAAARADALFGACRSTQKLKDMTNQLLMMAQAESTPQPALIETDFGAVLASALEEMLAAAQRRNIDLGAEIGEDLCVKGNPELLMALVTNLIDNAIRYTQTGGRVTVVAKREADRIESQVMDNGPGLPDDIRERAFERFVRGSTSTDGTGLGLPIAREIARRHGGDVALAPGADGRGLTATVILPAARSQGAGDEAAAGRR